MNAVAPDHLAPAPVIEGGGANGHPDARRP